MDAEHLPYKLSNIERDKWLTLPFMSIDAIKNYLINDKRIIEPADYHSDYYTDLAESFFKLTNGHPLHLIYSLEAALNGNSRLLPYDIERLPACPQNDIREYYRNALYVLANSSNIEQVQQKCIDANYNNGLIYLFNHLCMLKRTDHIKKFISKNIDNYEIVKRLCIYAIEQKIDLNTWGLHKEYLEKCKYII